MTVRTQTNVIYRRMYLRTVYVLNTTRINFDMALRSSGPDNSKSQLNARIFENPKEGFALMSCPALRNTVATTNWRPKSVFVAYQTRTQFNGPSTIKIPDSHQRKKGQKPVQPTPFNVQGWRSHRCRSPPSLRWRWIRSAGMTRHRSIFDNIAMHPRIHPKRFRQRDGLKRPRTSPWPTITGEVREYTARPCESESVLMWSKTRAFFFAARPRDIGSDSGASDPGWCARPTGIGSDSGASDTGWCGGDEPGEGYGITNIGGCSGGDGHDDGDDDGHWKEQNDDSLTAPSGSVSGWIGPRSKAPR